MCGIFGYIGDKRNATQAVYEGLKNLDYRGYDSWGIGILKDSKILLSKRRGKISKKLVKLPKSKVAIGHTRWATHGAVNDTNAHPHYSSNSSFVLAQNGIMENYSKVKDNLFKKYYKFISETDTEVIVRLIENEQKRDKDLIKAVISAFKKIKGRNTIIVLTDKGQIIAVRNGSPLVLGYSNDKKEIYVSSDTLSFSPHVDKTVTLENNQMVCIEQGKINILNIKSGRKIKIDEEENKNNRLAPSKGKYKHYMLKEINEQPKVITTVTKQNEFEIKSLAKQIKNSKNVYCIGSGTAGAAAYQTAYYLRKYAKINTTGLIGAECSEYVDIFTKEDLIIAPSQSGETADVLEIIEKAKKKKVKIASYVNMPGSLMSRMSDFPFMTNAGPEVCVMSTKVFISQLAFGYLLAKTVQGKYKDGVKNLKQLSTRMKKNLNDKKINSKIKKISNQLKNKKHIFLLGKGQNLQIIKEGMVKIIEGSYIHAHYIPAGDLKHYAITLMEPGVPVIPVLSNDETKTDVESAISEVRARGAQIIYLPETIFNNETDAILNVVPLQLLAYYLAVALGNNVDKPRNIAKSVTVK